jgi:hypothetical protein
MADLYFSIDYISFSPFLTTKCSDVLLQAKTMVCCFAEGEHMKILLPKTLYTIDPSYGPLFFLAGPIRGGGDWQATAVEEIGKCLSKFYAVLPCRYEDTHPLMQMRLSGDEGYFARQLTWERHYLSLAAVLGCIIFWLPCEGREHPRIGGEPYAMDTRGELGEWRGALMHGPSLRVVVGAERNFPGLSQIERNFNLALEREFPIY